MANEQPSAIATPVVVAQPVETMGDGETKVVVYQHSNIFYWWPVWFFGFLFAGLTYFGSYQMAIVPAHTKALRGAKVIDKKGEDLGVRDILVLSKDEKHLTYKDQAGIEHTTQPEIYVSRYRSFGSIFLFILLVVIFITNITLRGQWSVIVLVVLSSLVVIFWLAGYWEIIFERLAHLSIYINLGGYVMIALVVFVLWLVTYFFFDRQIYVVFAPGNVRLRLELGAGEIIYSTFGMVVQKKRSDLFRHSVLGFGSGDLIIRFPKDDHPIELHNILNINRVLKRIENMSNVNRPTNDPSASTSSAPHA